MLSSWFRMKYPTIVDGALAASAPIRSFAGVPDSPTFFETTTNDFARGNPNCPDLVRAAFKELFITAATPEGLLEISQQMQLCKNITSSDLEHLILWVVNSFGNLAMFDYPYPTNSFGADLPAFPLTASCHIMVNNSENLIYALAQAAGIFYNGTDGSLPCYDIYTEFVFCADQTGCGTGPDSISWDYQCCSNLIFFPNTNGVTDMFPPRNWNLSDLDQYCQMTWQTTPRPNKAPIEYSADEYQSASKIIFSNGLLDPWHGGGVLTNYSDSLPCLIVEDGAHHLDLRASDPLDPPSVIWVRASEAGYFNTWMMEAREKKYGINDPISYREASFPWAQIFFNDLGKKNSEE